MDEQDRLNLVQEHMKELKAELDSFDRSEFQHFVPSFVHFIEKDKEVVHKLGQVYNRC